MWLCIMCVGPVFMHVCVYMNRTQFVFIGQVAWLEDEKFGHKVNKSEYLTLTSDMPILE